MLYWELRRIYRQTKRRIFGVPRMSVDQFKKYRLKMGSFEWFIIWNLLGYCIYTAYVYYDKKSNNKHLLDLVEKRQQVSTLYKETMEIRDKKRAFDLDD